MAKGKTKRVPKNTLKLADLEQSKSAVLTSLSSSSSQRSYEHAIKEFVEWYCSEPRLALNKTVVTRYRISLEQRHYAPSTINLRLAAVRRLVYEAADNGLLSSDLAAGIRRVKGVKKLGVKVGNWLTAEQGRRLLAAGRSARASARKMIVSAASIWAKNRGRWRPSRRHHCSKSSVVRLAQHRGCRGIPARPAPAGECG